MVSLQNNRNIINTGGIFDNTSTKIQTNQKEKVYNKKILKQVRFFVVHVTIRSSCFQRRRDSATMVNKEQEELLS